MRRLSIILSIIITAALLLPALINAAAAQSASVCIDCHSRETPVIVSQWQKGKMGQKGMDCSMCHGSGHRDGTDVAKAKLPTPDTCMACHQKRVEQFVRESIRWHGLP